LLPAFMPVSCLDYSPTLKMKVTFSSKMSTDFQQTILCYSPKDRILHNNCCKNL
jgi:hypothetical protein